jgi:hypothetical protein
MDGYLTDDVVAAVRCVLDDADHRKQMVGHNYEVARQFFSYAWLEAELRAMLAKPGFRTPAQNPN